VVLNHNFVFVSFMLCSCHGSVSPPPVSLWSCGSDPRSFFGVICGSRISTGTCFFPCAWVFVLHTVVSFVCRRCCLCNLCNCQCRKINTSPLFIYLTVGTMYASPFYIIPRNLCRIFSLT
jgi:hypothetical protein